jgi:DNA-binding Lrp family transcriptional regulator
LTFPDVDFPENFPDDVQPFAEELGSAINNRVKKLVDNKILRICSILDPRYAYDESIFSKSHWAIIEDELIEYGEKGILICSLYFSNLKFKC